MYKKVPVDSIVPNNDNPRLIKEIKFKKLVQSIKDFPEMLELRPIVVDEAMMVLGGNMRLRAIIEAGIEQAPIKIAKGLTEEQKKEFIVKDNLGYGEWDWDVLANEWDVPKLDEWGLELPPLFDDEEPYTKKIDAPEYIANEQKPKLIELIDEDKTNLLIENINKTNIDKAEKDFLIKAAQRHLTFDYAKIADFYAHSKKEIQELMEDSALIIIDFKKAINLGYVNLNEKITNQYIDEYGDE